MKVRNTFLRVVSLVAFAAAVFGAAAIFDQGRSRAAAFNPQPDLFVYGMIGITREQTARLNVVNWGDVQPGPCRSSGEVQPGPCRVQVEFIWFDSQGNRLARSVQTLERGHAGFLDLDGATLDWSGPGDRMASNRTQIRANVRLYEDPSLQPVPSRNAANLAATVEVFDNFGPDAGKSRFAVDAFQPTPR